MRLAAVALFFSSLITAQQMDLNYVRQNYKLATQDKKTCKNILQKLENQSNTGTALAYYGALQSVWAKHATNPIEKLSTFRKGKKNIDAAVQQKPDNIEIRFLRYSVQKESPSFLGYKSNMDDDRRFLQRNLQNADNLPLKDMIQQVLNSKS